MPIKSTELLQDEFNKQSAQALEDYLQTGLHSTESEVNDWLSSWGMDSEKDAPECHKSISDNRPYRW